ncbi:HK97-gp10 family putative phage morphogenesis protein [Bacillus sp. J33]|uniref:HK97-gp10 family putative phage morphogenesis protein n=1 Tax=Bacillus sp. J33 TaxID=935836 RepID=UPI00047DFDDC|nr:HK97-gp10 family putative phage morphogenesis protein [Bacillus sp. J33]
MSARVSGLNRLLNDLERRLGRERMQAVSDEALKAGAEAFVRELKSQFESFKDTGASIDEITVSEPMSVAGVRSIKVHWRGPKDRYRIIHLNEWGTVKNPNPKGKGAIARALRNSENAYKRAVEEAVRRGI